MEKNKNSKMIAIAALIVAVIGLSLGFAAFSRVLTIQSGADVTPSEEDFKVVFSSEKESQASGPVSASTIGSGASGESATISGTQITGLKAKFTKPGQTVTYTFYARNEGEYNAYLKSIIFDNADESKTISCTAGNDTDSALVAKACNGIEVTVTVGEAQGEQGIATNNSNPSIDDHLLPKKGSEPVVVKIEYKDGSDVADGSFTVKIGDVKLNYSTQDL